MGQAPGDERIVAGDGEAVGGTSGRHFGLSGVERQAVAIGWFAGMAIAALFIFFDIVTQTLGPASRAVGPPVIEEMSSWLTTTPTLLLPAAVAVWLRRGRRSWWSAALAHAAGAFLYFTLHVGGFLALRKVAFPLLLGADYRLPSVAGLLYEAAKDIPTYAFAATGFWLILRWLDSRAAHPGAASGPASFDIRDGTRLLRVPVTDILAVRSAGNYVEFLLGDGRSPLMRAALSALEPRLAALGFVRTHRSWLVNSARMSGLRPDGSGDYTVELGSLEAPLSRRYREALEVLKR